MLTRCKNELVRVGLSTDIIKAQKGPCSITKSKVHRVLMQWFNDQQKVKMLVNKNLSCLTTYHGEIFYEKISEELELG